MGADHATRARGKGAHTDLNKTGVSLRLPLELTAAVRYAAAARRHAAILAKARSGRSVKAVS
jgi:hypothetical protein